MPEDQETATESKHRILVIDDEGVVCLSCSRILSGLGYEVVCKQDPYEGLQAALSGDYDVILLDLVMPGLNGVEVLRRIRDNAVSTEVIIITGHSTVETAVETMKMGAADYVGKPFTPDELTMTLQKVLERSALIKENAALRKELELNRGFEGMIGESRAMQHVFALIKRVAPTEATILITGESGTGKEMVARALHRLSPRKDRAFLACDCSALAPTLLESELFGHVKGSFSGAVATKQGLFEVADNGTLFLDEVANISMEIQGKLLRALETRMVRKVGDTVERKVDIRLVTATNRDLADLVKEGKFREDLYYRLHVVPIDLPPLRERKGDIALLAMTFLEILREKMPFKAQGFTPEAMSFIENYDWPGNVRQLKNFIERLAILCDSDRVEPRHLPREVRSKGPAMDLSPIPTTWEEFKLYKQEMREAAVRDIEIRFLRESLERASWNVSKAAEDIGMQRTNLHSLMLKYGIASKDN